MADSVPNFHHRQGARQIALKIYESHLTLFQGMTRTANVQNILG
jgi:hypothetical protein